MSTDPQHQLVPAYRATGPRVLCMWHEDSVGNHVILAKNAVQLTSMLPAILWKKHPKLKAYWEIDIVLPPPDISQRFATAKARNELDLFEHWFCTLAQSYKNMHKKFPPGIGECPGFSGEEYNKKYHIECQNCNGRGMILGLDLNQQLERLRDKFRSDKKSCWIGSRPMFSGQSYDPERKLYMAYLNGGPHRPGIVISAVKDLKNHPLSEYTLFFFHGNKLAIPQSLTDVYKKYEKDLKGLQEAKTEHYKKQLWELKVERAKLVTEIFGADRG